MSRQRQRGNMMWLIRSAVADRRGCMASGKEGEANTADTSLLVV
uniref:Uncharacterized protein n=1 Tax=Anguilla anguilla TaxID=7936 RepID=A0A0E9UKS3_ANGAN